MTQASGWGVGHKLRKRRKNLGMSLKTLADETGLHFSSIDRVELGDRRATADMLLKLAEPLGFTKIELLIVAGYLDRKELVT